MSKKAAAKKDALGAAVAAAWDRLCRAKVEMDYCRVVFEKAEDEWHQACVEHDRLEEEQRAQPYS